jgi:hypothetical protein
VLLKCSLLVVLYASLVVAQGCSVRHAETPEFTFVHEVTPQPPRTGPVTITITIKDTSGAPVTGSHLKLEGNMSHAGMAPVFAEASETGPGRYRSVMELSMAGDWLVTTHVNLPDGRKVDHEFAIKGVEP